MCIRDRDQIYRIEADTGERVSNIVVMGSGEPMDNYDNLILSLIHIWRCSAIRTGQHSRQRFIPSSVRVTRCSSRAQTVWDLSLIHIWTLGYIKKYAEQEEN